MAVRKAGTKKEEVKKADEVAKVDTTVEKEEVSEEIVEENNSPVEAEDSAPVDVSVEVTETSEEKDPTENDAEKEDAIPKDDTPEVSVTVDEIDSSKIPVVKNVRVKLREDIRLNFAGELYDMKKGSCYHVSPSLKLHLNKLGVLAPL